MIRENNSKHIVKFNNKGFFMSLGNTYFFLCFLLVFLTFGMKDVFFYISWITEGAIIITYLFYLNYRRIIKKIDYKVLGIMSIWTIYCMLIPIFNSIIDVQMHMKILLLSFFYIIVCIATCSQLFESNKKFYGTMYYFSLFWTIITFISLIFFIKGVMLFPRKQNFSGIYWDRNVFSMITLFFNTFLLFYKDSYSDKIKKRILLIFVLNSFFILFSLSFTGFLGLSIILLIYIKFCTKSIKKLGVGILLIACLFGIFFTENSLKYRIERFTLVFTDSTQLNDSESAYGRVYLMQQSLQNIKENFWIGVGVNNSRYYITRGGAADKGTFSHNNYLESMLNGGVINFILFYIPIIAIIRMLIKNWRKFFRNSINDNKNYIYVIALLCLKLLFDFTWVGYFEFGLVFIYVYLYYFTVTFIKGDMKSY